MWEACSQGEEAQQHFLEKIHINANTEYAWILRPHKWQRSDDKMLLQCSVHALSGME